MTTAAIDLHALPPVIPLWPSTEEPNQPAAGPILGMSRSMAYELAKSGRFPVRLLRFGVAYRVSRADLLAYLGETTSPEPITAA